jgi:hypothetical protein
MMSEIKEHLLRFGYTQNWIDFGFLNEAGLKSQVDQQRLSGDLNFEHFRYATFASWIRVRDSASDEDISNFTLLAFSDPDKIMAGSALADLIDTPWITDNQFEFLAHKAQVFGDWTEKRIIRAKIIRELDKGHWTPQLFEMALAQKDRLVHERLVAHPNLSRPQMKKMAEEGANRGIRARADEALKSKRFQNEKE